MFFTSRFLRCGVQRMGFYATNAPQLGGIIAVAAEKRRLGGVISLSPSASSRVLSPKLPSPPARP